MKLRISFDMNDQIFSLSSAPRIWDSAEVLTAPGVVVDFPAGDSNKPVGLEVLGFEAILPLGKKNYSATTDTQSFGDKDDATLVVENEDLVAYFGPQPYDPDYLYLLAVELRNASMHLAPLIASLSGQTFCTKPGLD